jgi:hypothetical protein
LAEALGDGEDVVVAFFVQRKKFGSALLVPMSVLWLLPASWSGNVHRA